MANTSNDRDERLRAALRANLQKRKMRERDVPMKEPEMPAGDEAVSATPERAP